MRIDLPDSVPDTHALRDWLGRSDPILLESLRDPALRVAVNQVLVSEPHGIAPGDEIAFLSPVSGG